MDSLIVGLKWFTDALKEAARLGKRSARFIRKYHAHDQYGTTC